MELSKKYFIVLIIFIIGCFICACGKEDNNASESLVEDTKESAYIEKTKGAEEEAAEQWSKGYDLPVDEQEAKEAENDCIAMIELISDIYEGADKGSASNVVLSDKIVFEMQKKLAETKCSITTLITYSNMEL